LTDPGRVAHKNLLFAFHFGRKVSKVVPRCELIDPTFHLSSYKAKLRTSFEVLQRHLYITIIADTHQFSETGHGELLVSRIAHE
jgi:hypothetical protein